jgi:predicted HTH domain antitoxin
MLDFGFCGDVQQKEESKNEKEDRTMTSLTVLIPDELVALLGSEDAARRHLRRAAVLDLVKRHAISQGRGAELLEMSLWEFHELMAETDVPVVDLTEPELKEGQGNLQKALRNGEP